MSISFNYYRNLRGCIEKKQEQIKIKYLVRIIHLVNVELPSSKTLLFSSALCYFLLGSQEQPLSQSSLSVFPNTTSLSTCTWGKSEHDTGALWWCHSQYKSNPLKSSDSPQTSSTSQNLVNHAPTSWLQPDQHAFLQLFCVPQQYHFSLNAIIRSECLWYY